MNNKYQANLVSGEVVLSDDNTKLILIPELLESNLEKVENYYIDRRLIEVRKGNKYGFIDLNGKKIVSFKYDYVSEFKNGLCLVKKNGLFGYINQIGQEVIPCNYVDAMDFSFDKAVYIYGAKNTYICINNCNFNKGFVLNCDNFCSINSSYITDELFVHIFANKLELNDVFINSSSYYLFYNFYIKMKAKDVNIKNCKIGNSKQRVKISVDSFNLIVDDSELVGEDIFIDSSNISFNNGLMMADKCVTVKGSSESNLDIVSPNIICNNKYKKRYKKRNNE